MEEDKGFSVHQGQIKPQTIKTRHLEEGIELTTPTITTPTISTPTITSPIFTLGSDATGDIFYRDSSGSVARLGIGSTGQIATVAGGLPSWATASVAVHSC